MGNALNTSDAKRKSGDQVNHITCTYNYGYWLQKLPGGVVRYNSDEELADYLQSARVGLVAYGLRIPLFAVLSMSRSQLADVIHAIRLDYVIAETNASKETSKT